MRTRCGFASGSQHVIVAGNGHVSRLAATVCSVACVVVVVLGGVAIVVVVVLLRLLLLV